jgi:hypothetical protein
VILPPALKQDEAQSSSKNWGDVHLGYPVKEKCQDWQVVKGRFWLHDTLPDTTAKLWRTLMLVLLHLDCPRLCMHRARGGEMCAADCGTRLR